MSVMRDGGELLRFSVGDPALYVNPDGTTWDGDVGIVTRVGVSWVFASFPPENTSIACHPDRLAVVPL